MGYTRDRDAHTRRVGAIAALDAVSSRARAAERAKAIAMARRDAMLARVAMGAINTGYTGGSGGFRPVVGPGPGLETSGGSSVRTPGYVPPPSPPSGPTPTSKLPADLFKMRGTKAQRPPAAPPPPVIVTDEPPSRPTKPLPPPPPPAPPDVDAGSGSGGGAGGGGGGSTWAPPSPRAPITMPDIDVIDEPLDSQPKQEGVSTKTLLIAGGLLVGAYLLWKKD